MPMMILKVLIRTIMLVDMNVPLATHTDFDADMLSIGARSNFSSVPKNGLNHFFGRVL